MATDTHQYDGTIGWGDRCGSPVRNHRSKAKQRTDLKCKLPAGHGTDHPGVGQCKLHGGSSAAGIRMAAKAQLALLTGNYPDVSPIDALLMCVRIAAAEVQFYTTKIAALQPDEITTRPVKEATAGSYQGAYAIVDLKGEEILSLWVRERQRSLDKLANYSSCALKAGVEDRLVRLAEGMGERLATTLEAILNELQLTAEQQAKAPQVIERQLFLLEGGAA